MKYVGIGFLIGLGGYVLAAFLSYYLIGRFSPNGHDRSVEASMTNIFVWAPIGFILSANEGYIWAKHTL